MPMEPRERVRLGDLELEFINVTHTIPASYAIAVHSPAGTIINTGDFKFDPTPVMGAPTDEARLRELGDQGVLALFSDTTRVETPGHTPSERVVMETLDRVIRDAKGQTLIATFASNISRVYMVLKAAEKYGKKVAVAGALDGAERPHCSPARVSRSTRRDIATTQRRAAVASGAASAGGDGQPG